VAVHDGTVIPGDTQTGEEVLEATHPGDDFYGPGSGKVLGQAKEHRVSGEEYRHFGEILKSLADQFPHGFFVSPKGNAHLVREKAQKVLPPHDHPGTFYGLLPPEGEEFGVPWPHTDEHHPWHLIPSPGPHTGGKKGCSPLRFSLPGEYVLSEKSLARGRRRTPGVVPRP